MRLDQVEHRPGQRHQRKGTDAAGDGRLIELVNLLEGEAEKDREGHKQGQALGEFDCR